MDFIYNYSILKFFLNLRNPFLNRFFIIITDLGSLEFYLILISFLFFIFDDRKTLKIVFLLIISYFLNSLIKVTFKLSRPDEKIIEPIYKESGGGYGFPSGHSQNSTVTWFGLYTLFKKRWLLFLSIIIISLVSVSRLYLGLHFLFDIIGGFLIGSIVLTTYFKFFDKFVQEIFSFNLTKIIILSIVFIIISYFIKEYSFILLSLSGLIIGIILNKNVINKVKNFKDALIRILIGYPVIFFLIYFINVTNFQLIYLIIGLWVTYFSRLIFQKLKI